MDALAVDSRRFGKWADRDYRVHKAIECFGLQFGVHYPYEERPAARNKRLSPIHDLMVARGAVMGAAFGWERPNWFSDIPNDEAVPSFRRSNWFDPVACECRTVTTAVGLADMSVFAKFDITGPDARRYVDSIGANKAPRVGRIGLTHALSPAGGTESEFTVAVLAEDHIYLTSAAAAEERDEDLLRARANGLDVIISRVTDDYGVLGVMGPNARTMLERLSSADLGSWLSVSEVEISGIPVRAIRVSYIGELGWELHVAVNQMRDLFMVLEKTGRAFGLGYFGAYAMNAMRLEKGYPAWGADFTTERTPAETGAGHLIKMDHEFTGKAALTERMQSDDRWEMVLLEVETTDVDPYYAHGVYQQNNCVGIVTSAAHGHRTGKTLAMAYLRDRTARDNLTVEILGKMRTAQILSTPPFDPENIRMKG